MIEQEEFIQIVTALAQTSGYHLPNGKYVPLSSVIEILNSYAHGVHARLDNDEITFIKAR